MAFKSGVVALLGKPNVGKSTLLNLLVGQKVSIVSNKPQTTRRRALGIARTEQEEIIFIDTPGIHEPHTKLGRMMIEEARQSLSDVDLVLFVADISRMPDAIDGQIAQLVVGYLPVFLCFNKMDRLPASEVIKHVEAYTDLFKTEDYVLTCATKQQNLDLLQREIISRLPEGDPQFDADTFTDQSMKFMASELIREQVLIATHQEVPHATAVLITEWMMNEDDKLEIHAEILVEKTGQRAILIGNQGKFIREIGTQARKQIEDLIGEPIYLDLHVKVRENWRMNAGILREVQDNSS